MIKNRRNAEATEVFGGTRSDGRFVHPFWACYNRLKEHKPKLAFDPQLDSESYLQWQGKVADKLAELVCMDDFQAAPPACKMLWAEPRDGYELQKWEAYPEPYAVYPFYMLVPDNAQAGAPLPAVVCTPGGMGRKEGLVGEPQLDGSEFTRFPEHNQQAVHFAKAGWVALALDSAYGLEVELCEEVEPEDRDFMFHEIWLGRSPESISVTYKLQVIRWLREHSLVDPTKIAVSGHSMSTTHISMMALLDRQIKAVVFNDFVTNWQERQIATTIPSLGAIHLLPGMLRWFDYSDLMAALAPIPLFVLEGGRTRVLNNIAKAYELTGSAENFRFSYYPEYQSEQARIYDDQELPEGISAVESLKYSNVGDAVNYHHFHEEMAVEWLKEIF